MYTWQGGIGTHTHNTTSMKPNSVTPSVPTSVWYPFTCHFYQLLESTHTFSWLFCSGFHGPFKYKLINHACHSLLSTTKTGSFLRPTHSASDFQAWMEIKSYKNLNKLTDKKRKSIEKYTAQIQLGSPGGSETKCRLLHSLCWLWLAGALGKCIQLNFSSISSISSKPTTRKLSSVILRTRFFSRSCCLGPSTRQTKKPFDE